MTALNQGDLSVRLPLEWTGVAGKVVDAFNQMAERLNDSTRVNLPIRLRRVKRFGTRSTVYTESPTSISNDRSALGATKP